MVTDQSRQAIIVVSGLPRSGTSLMMKMLTAGGLPALADGLRAADEDNPEGYFELEQVKGLGSGTHDWLVEAPGKAVKIISALLKFLPAAYTYKVIFMQRRMSEVLASQRRMLVRRGEMSDTPDETMAAVSARHLRQIQAWLAAQPNFAVLNVDYNALLLEPRSYAEQVNAFLGWRLNVDAMCAAVNPTLYRNRIP